MKSIVLIIALTGIVHISSLAQHSVSSIQEMLEQRDVEIKELVGPEGTEHTEAQKEELKEIINGVIDFEAMSRTALEETFDEISEEERNEFVELFTIIIRDNSLVKMEIYRASISYLDIELNGDKALVKTMAELDDVRTPVDYQMEYKSNEWVITDMSIDEVWTAESYNRQFQRQIARRGFDALMETLRERAAR